MYAGYSDVEQKGCVLARAAAHTVQQTAFFARMFTFGGGFAILAAGAVNMHKVVWAFNYLVRARPPLRGILVQPPKWHISLKLAANLAIAQTFLLFVSMTFLGVGIYAVLSAVAGETPQTFLDTRSKLQSDCRIVLEQAP